MALRTASHPADVLNGYDRQPGLFFPPAFGELEDQGLNLNHATSDVDVTDNTPAASPIAKLCPI